MSINLSQLVLLQVQVKQNRVIGKRVLVQMCQIIVIEVHSVQVGEVGQSVAVQLPDLTISHAERRQIGQVLQTVRGHVSETASLDDKFQVRDCRILGERRPDGIGFADVVLEDPTLGHSDHVGTHVVVRIAVADQLHVSLLRTQVQRGGRGGGLVQDRTFPFSGASHVRPVFALAICGENQANYGQDQA